jgi:hypothetical protein
LLAASEVAHGIPLVCNHSNVGVAPNMWQNRRYVDFRPVLLCGDGLKSKWPRQNAMPDINDCSGHVCFTCESGHLAAHLECPLSAKSGCQAKAAD